MRTRTETSPTPAVPPPEPARLTDQVETQIEDLIVNGEFKVGTRLPGERGLLQRFSVSRTVIREAISRLESRGLLRVYPSRGTFVTGTPEWGVKAHWQSWIARDSHKVLALLEVRECLEIRAAALATERATDHDLAELRLAHLNFEQQCARGSLADMSHWDKMFHYALATCSRNEVLASFVQNANDVVMSLRRSTLADPAVARRSLDQHRRILEAVESRDADRAMQAVADHIASTRETISRLAKAGDGPAAAGRRRPDGGGRSVTRAAGERIAILGAGPGGIAAAAVFARAGHDVALFNRSVERLALLVEAGGVGIEGDLGEEFVRIPSITTDIADAVTDRELVFCFVPAYGQRPLAELAAPHLDTSATFVLASGSAGSLEVAQVFAEHGLDVVDDVLLGETLTLPQSARMTSPDRIRIRLPSTVRLAAFPARNNDRLYERLDGVIRFRPSPNVLDTGINNVNFIIHPAPMLLNYAAVERADGFLSIMNEGMTDGVLRCMDALDAEKMALAEALGLEPISIDDLYRETGSGPEVYRRRGEPFGLRDRIWPRYIEEDTPYGTVMLSSLGRQLGVPMPVSDAINTLLSVVETTDFIAAGRTAETLGLAGMSAPEITHFLAEGSPTLKRDRLSAAKGST